MDGMDLLIHDTNTGIGKVKRNIEFIKKQFPNQHVEGDPLSLYERLDTTLLGIKDIIDAVDYFYIRNQQNGA